PALPGFDQLVVVAAASERLLELVEIAARLRAFAFRAILAFAVHRAEARHHLSQLRAMCGVTGRRRRDVDAQELDGARGLRRELLAVVALRFLRGLGA